MKSILVTGGAGYIGSHTVKTLVEKGLRVIALDNLCHGHREAVSPKATFVQADVSDEAKIRQVIKEFDVETVMHFAAFIEVGESVQNPQKYLENNYFGTLKLLNALREGGVRRFVFSSTAAVYGNPIVVPILEDHVMLPLNPYGESKMKAEMALADCARDWGLAFAALRYFNVAGASSDGKIGELHEPESHLIPRLLLAAREKLNAKTGNSGVAGHKPFEAAIFGTNYATRDGTCVRDYVHIEDLAEAHFLALKNLKPGVGQAYNVGSETGFTVREVIETCRRVTGFQFPVLEKERRPGDPAVLVASNQKIRDELGWVQKYPDLETIVKHAWAWHKSGHHFWT